MLKIIIPIFNDWVSLSKLLLEINNKLKIKKKIEILIIDDCSTMKHFIKNLNKLRKIYSIKILRLRENLGSQKAIYFGLKFLQKEKNNFFVTIMDGDGEDNPSHIKNMLKIAETHNNRVVVSSRKDRRENFLIKYLYKIHLFLTLILTFKWINFGNFSTFHSSNIKKILSNKAVSHAYSAGVLKNSRIIKTYSIRSKRYYENSKVSFLFLIRHSFKIIGVFYIRALFLSILYLLINFIFFRDSIYFFLILFFIINLLVFFNTLEDFNLKKNYIKTVIKMK